MSRLAATVEWDRIRAVVFDVDGTLYDQRCLRRKMLIELMAACVRRPATLQTLGRLRMFRRIREELAEREAEGVGRLQFTEAACRARCSRDLLEAEVVKWMYERPLRHLPHCRFSGVSRFFGALRASDRKIAIWSDYPTADKLEALGLEAEVICSALDPAVDRLKPHPAGLHRILDKLELEAKSILVIGDRLERDAAAAERVGVRCLLKVFGNPSSPDQFESFDDLRTDLEASSRSQR